MLSRRFSVAPMMDWTDRHERFFLRLISRRALLYTEMVTSGAVIHGDRQRLLGFSDQEHPVAVQLGGSKPGDLAEAARIAEGFGYDEINLNCGCPSDRVQSGRFGACLMAEPKLVAECVAAMQNAVSIPVTVKCRLGIDDQNLDETLPAFIEAVAGAGCKSFIVHARKAWLQGLSPKENRDVPPLDYDLVYRIKREYPELEIIVNGGIKTIDDAVPHLDHLDGVMVGRAAYQDPYVLAEVDRRLFGQEVSVPSRLELGERFAEYVAAEVERGTPLYSMIRHILGLFQGVRGARAFRRHISVYGPKSGAGAQVLHDALALIEPKSVKEAV